MRNAMSTLFSALWLAAAIETALSPQPLMAQAGLEACAPSPMPAEEDVFDSFMPSSELPEELKTFFWEYFLDPDIRSADSVLAFAVGRFGGPEVAGTLLYFIRSREQSGIGDYVRHQAGAAYGLFHTLYPKYAPSAPIAVLLTDAEYADRVKHGLVVGTVYVEEDSPEISLALGTLLCQTALHVRPFVRDQRDLNISDRARRLEWHESAVQLLRKVVYTLALRPGGEHIIREYLSRETNEVLIERVRWWADNPDDTPYWPR